MHKNQHQLLHQRQQMSPFSFEYPMPFFRSHLALTICGAHKIRRVIFLIFVDIPTNGWEMEGYAKRINKDVICGVGHRMRRTNEQPTECSRWRRMFWSKRCFGLIKRVQQQYPQQTSI